MSVRSEGSKKQCQDSNSSSSHHLSDGARNLISNIFDEFVHADAKGDFILDQRRFSDLFPMPEPISNAFFRAFCGSNSNSIDRSRFVDCLQTITSGGTKNHIKLLFGEHDLLLESTLEARLGELLEGFYMIVFSRSFANGRPLPKFIRSALRERVRDPIDDPRMFLIDSGIQAREITDNVASTSSDGRSQGYIALSDFVKYVRDHPGLKELLRLICRNIANVPGFGNENTALTEVKSYRKTLKQIIRSGRPGDVNLHSWKYCANVLSLPSPDLESRSVNSEGEDSDHSSMPSLVYENPLPTFSSGSYQKSIASNAELLKAPLRPAPSAKTFSTRSEEGSMPHNNPSCPGMYKICQACGMAIDVRYCCECGMSLRRLGIDLGCEKCASNGHGLHYKFCGRCGSRELIDRRLNLLPSIGTGGASDPFLKKHRRPKRGIRGFVYGELQEWFYVYDPHTERWNSCWALLADQFLLLFNRVQVPHPHRILSLQGRKLEIEEYHGNHDEYVIDISPSADTQDDGCLLITTDKWIGNRWLHQMRQAGRRRAIEDYYAIGECVFKLNGLVQRCICRHKLTQEKFLVTLVDKDVFDEQQIDKIRSSFALFKLLRHPSLSNVKDVFESATQFCVTVPLLNGGYLIKSLLQKGHFDESVVRLVIYPVINALIRIHQAGLDLINIRPECLVITPYAQHLIQIAHLDLNKFLSPCEILQRGLPKRLLSYRSPEVLYSGGPTWVWGASADMWAVGVLMFELLTGELPFDPLPGEFFDFAKALEDKFESNSLWSRISNEAKDVIRNLLQQDIDRRPSADALLGDPWFSIRL